ncbi:TolC family protein [bacterium]|nr:TolC family protein [bacterium]
MGRLRSRRPTSARQAETSPARAWQVVVIVLGWTILSTPGCVQPFFMTQSNYDYYNSMSLTYSRPGFQTDEFRTESFPPRSTATPTVKEQWPLHLADAKKIALENNKQVLAVASQPGQIGALAQLQLSQFDAFVSLGGQWSRSDIPLTSTVANAGTGGNSIQVDAFGQNANAFLGTGNLGGFGINATPGGSTIDVLQSIPGQNLFEVFKRNATGGTTNVNYSLGYNRQFPVGAFTAVNPAWTSQVTASITQPLLQGAGVEFNRAQILVTRANEQQSIQGFQTIVQRTLRDVESAYWQLGFAYYDLYSREVGLEQALTTWRIVRAQVEEGAKSKPDLAQAREQLEFFRAQRINAMQRVLEAERNLRFVLGIPPDDYRQIIPADEPTLAQYTPDWDTAVVEAVSLRPDVVAQTYSVRAAELEVFRQQNGLYPDLTVNGSWELTGLDNQFDQSIDRLTDGDFEGWNLGGRYRRPIGERASHAAVRRAQLSLNRERKELDFARHTALHELTAAFRNLEANRRLIDVQADRRRAAATQVEAREDLYQSGRTTLDDLLEAQTSLADSLRDEGLAISQYNQALIQWEFAKGTILIHDNVAVAESSAMRQNQKLIKDRAKWFRSSLPLSIWAGSKVSADHYPSAKDSQPFYTPMAGSVGTVTDTSATPDQLPAKESPKNDESTEPLPLPAEQP